MPSPIRPTRYYAYFTAIEREYTVPGFGLVRVIPELRWFGIDDANVLVLTTRETPMPLQVNESKRVLHEFVVVTDRVENLPPDMQAIGGYDPEGNPYPAYGVFVRMSTFYPTGAVERHYNGRLVAYRVEDLLSQSDSFAPISLFVSGVREVESHLDSASWDGPGSAIVYDREASFAWVNKSDADDFELDKHAAWRPGKAGVYERFLMGSGAIAGWDGKDLTFAVYALQHLLVVEFWRDGLLLVDRILDCQDLIPAGDEALHVIGMGYDFERGRISLGVAAKGEEGSGLVHKEWEIPLLKDASLARPYLAIGGDKFIYSDSTEGARTAWGYIRPVQGQFTSDEYLTRGKLTELMRLVEGDASGL